MDIKLKEKILKQHGVSVIVRDDKILAFEEYTLNGQLFGDWVDVTKHTLNQIKKWLGY